MNHGLSSGRSIQPILESAGSSGSEPAVHASAAGAAAFETLQRRLTQERLCSIDNLQHATQVKWASDEASSLAWMTGFPWLFFPLLFEEKSAAALERARRQDEIHERSRQLLKLSVPPVGHGFPSI